MSRFPPSTHHVSYLYYYDFISKLDAYISDPSTWNIFISVRKMHDKDQSNVNGRKKHWVVLIAELSIPVVFSH